MFFTGQLQAAVAHHRGDDPVAVQLVLFLQVCGANGHNGITVHHLPLFIHGNKPVPVTVEGQPQVRLLLFHGFLQQNRVGGAAVHIYLPSVRAAAECDDLRPQFPVQPGSCFAVGAVGAVKGNFESFQLRSLGFKEGKVALQLFLGAKRTSHFPAGGAWKLIFAFEIQPFCLCLQL